MNPEQNIGPSKIEKIKQISGAEDRNEPSVEEVQASKEHISHEASNLQRSAQRMYMALNRIEQAGRHSQIVQKDSKAIMGAFNALSTSLSGKEGIDYESASKACVFLKNAFEPVRSLGAVDIEAFKILKVGLDEATPTLRNISKHIDTFNNDINQEAGRTSHDLKSLAGRLDDTKVMVLRSIGQSMR